MIRGLYISATGMLAESTREEAIANNIANVNSTAYRRQVTATQPFSEMLLHNTALAGAPQIGSLAMGTEVASVGVVDAQGPLRATGNSMDVAVEGDGYITVAAAGGRRYTRAGDLRLDGQGRLITADGSAVTSVAGGPITLGSGPVEVSADGTVSQGGQARGQIRLVQLDPASLRPEGETLYTGTERGASTARLRQGFLEGSTVKTVTEMVDLIRAMRAFESNQRAVQAQDETLEQAVTRVGAIG